MKTNTKATAKKATVKKFGAFGLKAKMDFVKTNFIAKRKSRADAVKALIAKYKIGLNYARNIVYFRLAK